MWTLVIAGKSYMHTYIYLRMHASMHVRTCMCVSVCVYLHFLLLTNCGFIAILTKLGNWIRHSISRRWTKIRLCITLTLQSVMKTGKNRQVSYITCTFFLTLCSSPLHIWFQTPLPQSFTASWSTNKDSCRNKFLYI